MPKDFDPFKKVKEQIALKNQKTELQTRFKANMDPAKRAQLLGEDIGTPTEVASDNIKSSNAVLDAKIQNISDHVRQKILGVKQFVKGAQQDMHGSLDLPFNENLEKQKRYLEFANQKEGRGHGAVYTGQYNLEKIKNENSEFERFYKMYQKAPKIIETKKIDDVQDELLRNIDELQKQIKEDKAKRRVEQWIPDKLLCKRFNVATPYDKNVS